MFNKEMWQNSIPIMMLEKPLNKQEMNSFKLPIGVIYMKFIIKSLNIMEAFLGQEK
jgi:hypothetical protein